MTINSQAVPKNGMDTPLQVILEDASQELFAAYGIDVSTPSEGEGDTPLIGHIHFAGRAMSGTLTIGLDRAQLERSLPIENGKEADLEDWSRELANQLMGLVKTRLQKRGIDVALSLPSALRTMDDVKRPHWPSRVARFSVSCQFARALSTLDGVLVAEVALRSLRDD